jgi:golgin subfamily B member 1
MQSQTIRTALGQLQNDPDSPNAWQTLKQALESPERELSTADLLRLLDAARDKHRERGEWDAVASLLELETLVARGMPEEPQLVTEQARVLRDELFDEARAAAAWRRFLDLKPGDPDVTAALEESAGKREKWQQLVSTYASEAEQAPDDVYRSSMLMRAAEMELRFGGDGADFGKLLERLEQAVRLDPTNVRAGRMLEHIHRRSERWEEAARVLERIADRAETGSQRVEAGVRLARLFEHKLADRERAARAYERVLKERPDHTEAMAFLSVLYEREERWDDVVALYERDLKAKDLSSPERVGDMLQIGMLYWKNAHRMKDAETWFERIARLNPTHPGMLDFYRAYSSELGDEGRLIEVLQNAQRALKDGAEKTAIATEIARLAEGQENAQKAIEQYKGVLRQDPDNSAARDALKRLYKQTQGYNALVELLRQQLERTDPSAYETRLGILREVAAVYRQYIKSDTALVSVLNQIVQLDEKLDENDVDEMRELVQLYEKLGRWRDLLTNQLKLAEITPDVDEKRELFRSAARRWLEQFSNVQNATEAYEALLAIDGRDREARERLNELYRKRRAWPALYALYEREIDAAEPAERVGILKEMATLAAERLNRGSDAVVLYKRILEEDPTRLEVLDSLERHAERSKDWPALSEALERRVDLAPDDTTRLAVLQKLGSVYADHLHDAQAAASAWRRVLELSPGHHRALRVLRESYLASGDYDGLEDLYGSQGDWEGLAEVLSTAADRAREDAVKIDLSYRAARVFESELKQSERAFRSYERILATNPNDARAARALIPLYEQDEKWARLPALYEVLIGQADQSEKFDLLNKLVEVTGTRLSDKKAAVVYARKAYDVAPERPEALALLEETAKSAGSWQPFVEAIEARLATPEAAPAAVPAEDTGGKKKKKRGRGETATVPDGAAARSRALADDARRSLELKLAKIYDLELARTDDALRTYKRLLEREPSDHEAAAALETILRREDRREELRWLLDLRVQHTVSDGDRVRILLEWATLEEDVFGTPEQAVALYRRVLEIEPSSTIALRGLPRLLLASGDTGAAAEVIEKHRDQLGGEERAAREVELAELYITRLGRDRDALEASERALELSPGNARAIAVLERLVENDSTRARAARVLAEQYATGGEARHEAQALGVMLEQNQNRGERLALYDRLTDVHEEKLGAFGTALDVMLRAVREYPDELALWERADSLSVLAGRPTDLAETYREVLRTGVPADVEGELCERAAKLHEDKLGDPIGATPYLEKVLALSPGNERAFVRLKDILTAAERWSELEALYDRSSAATDDPVRRAEMLVEVALICEEIIEEAPKATRYYERIYEIDPRHEIATRALDRLYARQERHQDLAQLLEQRLQTASGDELLELELRLARIQLEKLHQPEQAIEHVENVLRERQNDYEARELAEKLLEIGSMRARSASMLEQVYEQRGEIRDLVRVLAIRLEELDLRAGGADQASDDRELEDERRELLRRVAKLRDERLHDDEGALEALARLVPADPLDVEARSRLLEIGRREGAHQRVADVLARSADQADTPGMKGEILMQVASIYEDLIHDPEQAERAYRRVLELDESDPELVLPAARALERIYVAGGQNAKLAEALRIQVRLDQDGDARKQLLGRLGELCQSVLGDAEAAIDAWRMRSEEHPADELALAALDRLYEENQRWRELVSVIDRRREVSEDTQLRRKLMVRSAQILADKLENVSDAIDAWRAVMDEFGPETELLIALESLYQRAERWDELAETYDGHLDLVDSDPERLELLAKLGDLRREHLNDVPGALESYRRALTLDAGHERSRAALDKLLGADDRVWRREAAEILHPIYETEAAHEKLLRVLEIEVDSADDPMARLDSLEKAINVAESSMKDPGRALGYAQRAVREAVGHTELQSWLEHLERLADATERQAEYVELLCQVVPEIFDGEVQLAVTLKIADLARHRLADRELARQYYQKVLELRADDKQALVALESLYEESGDASSLLEVLERRVEAAEDDQERKQLLFRRARLLAEVLEDRPRAIEAYEAILDIDLDPRAIESLEKLYAGEERWTQLVELFQRQLDAKHEDPAALRVRIAEVLSRRLGEVNRAFDELEEALELEKQHEGAIAELERLLTEAPEAEHRARAATILEPVYLIRADFGKVMGCIRARLDSSQDPDERRDLLSRLAQLYEEQQEDYVQALETTAKLLHEDPSDESTIGELERLAKVAGAERRLAEIYAGELGDRPIDDDGMGRLARRTGELFATLGELDRALEFLRRALVFEPDSRRLFEGIDAILEKTARHEQRVDLYRHALDHRFEPAERLELLHTIAGLSRRELELVDQAIETYRSALDVDEHDEHSLDALTELYRERKRWDDLAELLLRRSELAANAESSAIHRLALARLCKQELGDSQRAIDQLEEIVRSVPTHVEAIKELETLREDAQHKERVVEILRPLYEATDDWRHLIKLNEDRYQLARDPGEKVAVLRETSRLWEERGGDLDRARRALGVAFDIDPDDSEVRAELERLTEATHAWDTLAEAYENALANHPDLASKRDVLAMLADVHDRRRDDPRRALDAYSRLHEIEPGELEPVQKMEQLATLLSDWPALVSVLTDKADLILEDEQRASVWRRIGEARRDMLDDRQGAVTAYERALELDPASASTVDWLIALREGGDDAQALVELYQRRVELCTDADADLKYDLLRRAAQVYESKQGDRSSAIEMLNQALSVRPNDRELLSALNRLYRDEQQWPELLDNLKLESSIADSAEERSRLRKQMGEILAEKLTSYDDALEAYRLVLDETPDDAEAVAAVRRIGAENGELREPFAQILLPVLKSTARHSELVDALELKLSVETDPGDRSETLRTIAEVLETKLEKPGDAQAALLRALSERPEASELHAEIERLSELAGTWNRYADALSERANATFDPEVARDLHTRLGKIAEQKLSDPRRAVEAYMHAVEHAGDQPELLDALDRLHTGLGDARALSEIIERRVVSEESEAKQAELYHRLAMLQIAEFGEPARGLASLRMALERAPDHEPAAEQLERLTDQRDLFEEASEVLETVYRTRGRTDRLAALYEKRVGFADTAGDRIEMRKNLARVLEDDCADAAAAQRVLAQGLSDDLTDAQLIDELARLAPITGDWRGVAAALAAAIEQKGGEVAPDVARDLCVRLATWQRDEVKDATAAEAALEKALEFESNSDDVLVLIEQLQSAEGRERDLIQTLRRRAKLGLDEERREELYRRAKELADAQNDPKLAEEVLRELLTQDDGNLWALAELTTLREQAGDYRETFDLTVRRSELRAQGDAVRELRHRAAAIAREHLGDKPRAAAIYEQLFDDDPMDRDASAALRQLYAETERDQDLARLLERLIDLADTPNERGTLRIELALLNQSKFSANDSAIDMLRAVLDDEPGRSEAVVALSELYEKTGRDEELADLLNSQIAAARERGDQTAELEFQVRLGEICESRLGDRVRAIETYRSVLERDSTHRGALEALARLYQAGGEHARAAEIIEQLLGLSDGDEAVQLSLELADMHEKIGDSEAVARALERGLSADPKNAPLRGRLRSEYEAMKAWDKLAELLAVDSEQAEAVDDKIKLLRQAAGIHAQNRNDPARAAELLDKASSLKPDDRELLLELCDAYSASGRGKAAAEVLEKIVESYGGKRSKELGEIHRRLASAHLAEGQTERALEELDKAFRIEPGNVQVLTKLGDVAIQVGDMKKAQQMFRALLLQKLDASSPITKAQVFLRLGEIHEKIGEMPKAIQMVERAVQSDANLEEAKQKLARLKGS